MSEKLKIERVLISVSDKSGVAEFAKALSGYGAEIISTGGTARALRDAGIDVRDVSDVTGFPEMMDGRVKTLHPKIHGAFLALRDNPEHVAAMEAHGIEKIDMVVVNLYPFEETAANEDSTLEEIVEQIDIGGPAMIRSASKNWRDLAVVTNPALYSDLLEELESNNGSVSLETRARLAVLAYSSTSFYDLKISSFLASQLSNSDLEYLEAFNPFKDLDFIEVIDDIDEDDEPVEDEAMPEWIELDLAKVVDLRYGENPHQRAALYKTGALEGVANAEQLQGKEMSFNNYVDAEAAWNLVADFEERAVAIIKHTNPSGVGLGATNFEAHQRALATDPVSAFGGIVALNRTADAEVATAINEVFTEVVIAPDFDQEALDVFKKKKNVRVLKITPSVALSRLEHKQIGGGFLVQDQDLFSVGSEHLTVAGDVNPTDEQLKALMLAWKVCKHVKSNAIVLANEFQTVGVGAGQMNRVDSVRIAAMRAKRTDLALEGSVLASDAFFPFRDNVDEAAALGISAIIQPGGSMRDDESIAAANEHGIAMVFTGHRHFKH
ncbi:MAG: bifunctional phosphoribosylaminoimidazolecarboxamide formyltransferase/IMP cyclohydrolase [Pyrinomonadaceae bacterium]